MKMFKNASMLLAGLAALMLSVAAQASPVTYDGYDLKYGTSGAPTGRVAYPDGRTGGVYAGEITFHVSGGEDFNGFCIDLSTPLLGSGTYSPVSAGGLDTGALGALFELHYSADGMGQNNSAAFQLAIWSIVYNSVGRVLGPDTTFDPAIKAIAQGYLNEAAAFTGTSSYAFLIYDQEGNQNMLTWTRVPEPGTLALLGLGLLGAGAIRRRRS